MNDFERLMRQWKNQARTWLQSQFQKSEKHGRPNIRMCPNCGKFVGVNDAQCGYCETTFDKPAPERREETAESNDENGSVVMIFGLCALFYILSVLISSRLSGDFTIGQWMSPGGNGLEFMGANAADATFGRKEYWRLLTYMFLHGDVVHIVMNMMALAQLGPLSQHNFQVRRFWIIALIAGAGGGFLSAGSSLVTNGYSLSIGFSGALFGLVGANWVYFKRHGYREEAERFKKFMIWGNLICILLTIFNLLSIDNAAHIGGMIAGILVGAVFTAPVQPATARWVERVVLALLVGATIYGFFHVALDYYAVWR